MSKLHKAQTQQGHSRHFFEHIRSIGEAKSKQEEDKLVLKDLEELRKTLADKHPDKKRLKENVVRAFYGEMLGHPAEFAYIHCVNLTSNQDLIAKKTGYLASWLCINPEHELMYLLVANLQRDMTSNNFLEISAALTSCAKLIRPELMSAINGDVTRLLSHPNALVRKKAVLCMHSFYRKSDGAIGDIKVFREALCDKDPSVMGASLQLLYDVCLADPVSQLDLLPSFVSILKQITEHRLPRDFDYHRVPAPWLQLKLLKLLGALIGSDNKALAEKFKDVILETMKRAETGLNIGHALIFECINTITTIAPIPQLIEAAADAVAKFLLSSNANMKYLGVTALSRIVKIDRKYAQEHQQVVMGCLEDPDDTIRRKTIALLFAMCNERNVEAIVGRLLKFLADSTDEFLRQDLVKNICAVAERCSTNTQWYVDTMNTILELGSEHVPQTTIQGMLKLIAEGEGEDEALDAELRTYCVETYFVQMENSDRKVSNALYQVAAWVMGEYGFLTKKISRSMMLDRLCDMVERAADPITKGWIITAMMKIVAHNNGTPDNVEDLIEKFKNSGNVALQQRCYEFLELSKAPAVMKKVLPLDGCCEEIEVDRSLSFLDGIVKDALAKGARPYQHRDVRLGVKEDEGFKTEAYKTQRADIVDTEELTAAKFDEEEDIKLIVKDSARRWGAKNLEEEAAVDKPIENVEDVPESNEQQSGGHVDPQDMKHKPSKNEKFLNDIFGDGPVKKKKQKKGDRAKEALRRAQEAEKATKGMTTENTKVADVVPPSLPSSSAAEAAGGAAAGPSGRPQQSLSTPPISSPTGSTAGAATSSGGTVRVQSRVEKMQAPDALRVRIGVLPDSGIRNVRVHLHLPPKCSITGNITCNAPKHQIEGQMITIAAIPPNVAAFVEFMLKADDYPQGGIIGAEVRYLTPAGEEGPIRAGSSMTLTDILRPVVGMTSDVFGQHWGKLSGECKVPLRFKKQLTPDVLAQHLKEVAQLKIIQVIGKECIAGAKVAGCGHLLLCHMSVDGNNLNTVVRSNAKEFSDVVARQLAKIN